MGQFIYIFFPIYGAHAAMFSRKLQCERQRPLTFQDRCEELTGLRDKIQEESRKPQSFCSHQEVLSFHQVLHTLHTPNNNKDEQEPEPDTSLIICFFTSRQQQKQQLLR